MSEILFKIWNHKIKLIEDIKLFKALFLFGIGLTTILVIACEILFLRSNDFLLLFIINTLLVIYNKPTILSNIQRKISTSFFIDKLVLNRYILFQVLKENFFIIVAFLSYITTFIYGIITFKAIYLMAILLITINIYMLDIYYGRYKVMLMLCTIANAILLLAGNSSLMLVLFVVVICNILYLWYTAYNQLLDSVYRDKYTDVLSTSFKINLLRGHILYLLRMPLDKVMELIFQVLIMCIATHFVDINIVYFLLVAIFMVDIELIQDEKLKDFQFFYNKRNFLATAGVSRIRCFLSSMEFNYILKYGIMLLLISLIQISTSGFSIHIVWMYINLILLFYATAYRYYLATDEALKCKRDIKATWFRLVMLYLILFNLAPYIFAETLQGIDGYKDIYGYIFTAFINTLLLCVKIEKLTGGKVHDNIPKDAVYS